MILMGAQSRLLPPSVPFRFFAAAVAFQGVAWGLIALDAGQVPHFVGGPGFILAGVHALTLGVLVMTAIGASFQILPVVTGQSLMALWPCRLTFWLYAPGTALLVFGFIDADPAILAVGGTLVTAGLGVFALLMADVLRRTRGMRTLVLHGWAALISLTVLAGLGLMLAFNLQGGFFTDPVAVTIVHMAVAIYGFMGMLAFGYSQFMVPMFALGPSPDDRVVTVTFALAAGAVGLAVAAALAGAPVGLVAASAAGLAAVVLHVRAMGAVLVQGMRKRLGLSFVLVRVSWGLLAASVVLGGAAAVDGLPGQIVPLFGFVALFGWLLTFLMGILQRIVPFLAAMNAAKAGQTPPTLSDVSVETPLKIHAAGHFGALALVAAGIVTDTGMAVVAGALAGLVGAAAFLWFVADTLRRMRGYAFKAAAAAKEQDD
jgi:hypothetical protein